jgi:hypothetical protein
VASEKDTSERDTITVVMARELAAMVRAIANHRNITMAEAWDRYGRSAITSEYKRVLGEMQAVVSDDPAFATQAGAK